MTQPSHGAAYYCSECGLAVIILPEKEPIKICECEAAIVANLQASLAGVGGLT
jgi:hypothetical protein